MPCGGSFAAESGTPVRLVFPGLLSGEMLSRCFARFRCTVYVLYAINWSSWLRDTALVHDVLTARTPRCGAVLAPVSFPRAFDEGERRRGRGGRARLFTANNSANRA